MSTPAAPARQLSLFDAVCIMVGIIVGIGIFQNPPLIAGGLSGAGMVMIVWIAGGLLALAGALSYAELATAWPQAGGDYVYLNRAYGPGGGFMFAWARLLIVYPGDIAALAFAFGAYAAALGPAPFDKPIVIYAASAVVVLTLINLLGVAEGKYTQAVLTLLKTGGLLAVVVIGLMAPAPTQPAVVITAASFDPAGLKLAMILVLFTYGGWSDMVYVAAEIRDPKRNIVRGLMIGTAAVTLLYLLVNFAFIKALGHAGVAASNAVAVDTVAAVFPHGAAKVIGVLVCVSALGAINGMIFTGSRIAYAFGAEHPTFALLGRWSGRRSGPLVAILLQGIVSVAVIVGLGGFVQTVLYTAPVVWLFFLATGVSVFVLRVRRPQAERPYRVVGYPITPLIYCAGCVFMLYSAVTYALANTPAALIVAAIVLACGALVYAFERIRARRAGAAMHDGD